MHLRSRKIGSIQWIPEQIVGIGEDFHSQVDDGKVKTTVYRVRWSGYDNVLVYCCRHRDCAA